jgi:excisionase family DNA binding protein
METDASSSLSVKEAAKILRVATSTIYKMISEGTLKNIGTGPKRYRVSKDSVNELLGIDKEGVSSFSSKSNPSKIHLALNGKDLYRLEKLGINMSVLADKLLSREEVVRIALRFAHENQKNFTRDFFQ